MRKNKKNKQNKPEMKLGHYVGTGDDKGKLITPFNYHLSKYFGVDQDSWSYDYVPEYVWLGLILRKGNRTENLNKCTKIINRLHEICGEPYINLPKFSTILNLDKDKQESFFNYLKDINVLKKLSPLVSFNFDNSLIFNNFVKNYPIPKDITVKIINDLLSFMLDTHSRLSTDIHYLAFYTYYTTGKLVFDTSSEISSLYTYPQTQVNSEYFDFQKSILTAYSVTMELYTKSEDQTNTNVRDCFWEKISLLTDCEEMYLDTLNEDVIDLEEYKKNIYSKLQQFCEFYINTKPIDIKIITLLGMLTYSYKLISELIDHDLENTISGRTIFRSLSENYVMTKYLFLKESEHDDIWSDFQNYGLSKYKLFYERFAAYTPILETNHINFSYLDYLVSEYNSKDVLDITFNYFGGKGTSIKEKFKDVGEEDLYLYGYDYDSQLEHGLWGAIRESSILKCNSPGHLYHGVPDIDNIQKMKSVAHDCVLIMDKHIALLVDLFQ